MAESKDNLAFADADAYGTSSESEESDDSGSSPLPTIPMLNIALLDARTPRSNTSKPSIQAALAS